MDALYALHVDPEEGFRWRFRGATLSPPDFATSLWAGVLCQFTVLSAESGRLAGLVVAYQPSHENGHCRIGIVFAPWARGAGLVGDALALFIDYVFTTWPLRKLFAEIPGYNLAAFGSIRGRWVQDEGCLREFDDALGRWWDLQFVSLERSTWETTLAPIVDRIRVDSSP